MGKIYNIYISHSWSYPGDYDRLKDLLNNAPYFDFIDYSLPKDDRIHHPSNDDALYQAIYRNVRLCQIVLIMAGLYSVYSRWIDKEIEISKRGFSQPRPILVIKPRADTNVSLFVAQNAEEIVTWDKGLIISAIRDLVT